ncbi:MAG: amino acid ABC transporter permease, partial [Xanthobacteraceae bacterium]
MLIAVALLIAVLAGNVAANLQRLGVKTGFGFLERPAGFDISQTLISYGEQATYMSAFVVALLNTMLVTALAAMLATVLGF